MESEADEIQDLAVRSLKNELTLAISLLLEIEQSRRNLDLEDVAIESARGAFRHATDALGRMPALAGNEIAEIQSLMDSFRIVLTRLLGGS